MMGTRRTAILGMLARCANAEDTAERLTAMILEAGITKDTGIGNDRIQGLRFDDLSTLTEKVHTEVGEWLLGQWLQYFTLDRDTEHYATPLALACALDNFTHAYLNAEPEQGDVDSWSGAPR